MSADSGVKLRARSKDEDELRELDSVDANRGFSELRETTFVGLPAPECRLFIDDEPLDSLADSVNEWSWKPGFYAGEVRAELLDRDDHSLGVWRLDVSPDPDKTGRELFARMLHEISASTRSVHGPVGDLASSRSSRRRTSSTAASESASCCRRAMRGSAPAYSTAMR